MESPDGIARAPRRLFTRRRARRWAIRLVALTALWLLGSFLVAHRLTRRQGSPFEEPAPRVSWASFEAVRLPTRDGHELGAWFADGRAGAPSVVILHGNGGHRGHSLSRAHLLAGVGCAVLPVTFRAHGDSTGVFNDIGYSARLDVIAAVEYLERRRPGRPIVILGSSLGAAAATFASAELGHRVRGYILEAPYLDLKVAVRNRTAEHLPIGLEWLAYRSLVAVAPLVLDDLEKISPRDAIAGIPDDVPVLLISGGKDQKARTDQVEALSERVRGHGRHVIFKEAGHLHFAESDPDLYNRTILDFIREVARRPGGG